MISYYLRTKTTGTIMMSSEQCLTDDRFASTRGCPNMQIAITIIDPLKTAIENRQKN